MKRLTKSYLIDCRR